MIRWCSAWCRFQPTRRVIAAGDDGLIIGARNGDRDILIRIIVSGCDGVGENQLLAFLEVIKGFSVGIKGPLRLSLCSVPSRIVGAKFNIFSKEASDGAAGSLRSEVPEMLRV